MAFVVGGCLVVTTVTVMVSFLFVVVVVVLFFVVVPRFMTNEKSFSFFSGDERTNERTNAQPLFYDMVPTFHDWGYYDDGNRRGISKRKTGLRLTVVDDRVMRKGEKATDGKKIWCPQLYQTSLTVQLCAWKSNWHQWRWAIDGDSSGPTTAMNR